MKKLLVMMLCLLLPLCTLADGHGGIGIPKNYEEYLQMLKDNQYHVVSIRHGFEWPTEEVTMEWTGKNIEILGGTVIPENVTVYCNQKIVPSGNSEPVVINGDWHCLSDQGLIYPVVGGVTYNGEVTLTCDERVRLESNLFIFNGPVHLNARLDAKDLILGDGVVIDGEQPLYFDGTVSVPEGSATIGVELLSTIGNEDASAALMGQLALTELSVSKNSRCLIAAGSHVTVEKLSVAKEGKLSLDGTVELPADSRHNNVDGTVQLNDAGRLILRQNARLGNETDGQLTGTGTLQLDSLRRGVNNYTLPGVFALNLLEPLPEDRVAPTVKIEKNWIE